MSSNYSPVASGADLRLMDLLGVLLIGDGVLGMLHPAQHCLVWRTGPARWRELVEWFASHPRATRAAALAELCAGLWLGSSVHPVDSRV
jgi:hypothetical protein